MTKTDKILYKLGFAGLMVAAFCWGWNSVYFKK